MSLADRIAARAVKSPRCTVCRFLASLDDDARDEWQAAMDDPTVMHQVLADLMTEDGTDVAGQTVGRHRLGRCKR